MTARRFYLFAGNLPELVPTGYGATTYSGAPLTGNLCLINNNWDYLWQWRHAANNSGTGVRAYVWNRIGGGSAASPAPSFDQFFGPLTSPNSHTDPIEGGAYPSAWSGVEHGFLLGAHGYPYDEGRSNVLTRDPTFSIMSRSLGSEVIPLKETRGLVISVTAVSGTTVQIVLSHAHGESAGSTFTVWQYGFKPGSSLIPDPQLTGKFTATAHASNANAYTITLPTAWTGDAGKVATGVAVVPYYKITALSNPSANLVHVTLNHPFDGNSWDSLLYGFSAYADFWIGDVTGTVSDIDGMWNYLWNGARFAPTNTASTNVTFTSGTKTIARTSGSWDRTPSAGEKLYISGSTSNNGVVTVVSATASTIVVSEAIVTGAAGPSVTIHTLHILQFDYGAAVNLSGWNSDGFVFRQDKAHPVFVDDCGGELYIGRMKTDVAAYQSNLSATIFAGGVFGGDTLGDADSAIICTFGDADVSAVVDGTDYKNFCVLAWPQALRDIYAGMRDAIVSSLTTPPAAEDIAIVQLRTIIDPYEEFTSVASWDALASFAYQQAEEWAVANTPKAIIANPGDNPPTNGRWPSGIELVELGLEAWSALEQVNTPPATLADAVGIPVYVLLGQSQTVSPVPCSATQSQPAFQTGDPDYNGSWYNSDYSAVIRNRGCFIWHEGRATVEEYAPALNAVSYSDRLKANYPELADYESVAPFGSVVGPELTLILELQKRHPEGCVLYKLAVGGASLQYVSSEQNAFARSAGDLWVDIETWWGKFRTWCYENGRVPDVRAVFFDQGEGDTTVTETYADALTEFISDIRALLDTGTSSRAPLPFVIGQVQTHDRLSSAWGTALPLIQAAQQAVANSVENVAIASMQGLPIDDTDVHRTFHGIVIAGQRLADALNDTTMATDGFEIDNGTSINDEVTHGEASSSGSGSGGGSSTLTPTVLSGEYSAWVTP